MARTDHVAGDIVAAAEWNAMGAEVNSIPAKVSAAVDAAAGVGAVLPVDAITTQGDSLTVGTGGNGTSYGQTVAAALGVPHTLVASGGQSSTEAAIRAGALDPAFTVPGGSIPASGSVGLTVTTTGVYRVLAFTWVGVLTVGGVTIPGTLAHDATGGNWTFTRTTTGTAVTAASATFHCTEADTRLAEVNVLWAGTNNSTADDPNLAFLVRDIDMMARHLPIASRTLVMGIHAPDAVRRNTILASRFGSRFMGELAYVLANGLQLAGITPTAQDRLNIASGTVPPSLLSDTVHYTAAGYGVIARLVEQRIRDLGLIVGAVPPVRLPATAAAAPVLGAATQTTLPVTWAAVTGAVAYSLQYRLVGATAWLTAANTTGLSGTVTDPDTGALANATSHEIRVVPYANLGAGTPSATLTAATTGTPPAVLTSDTMSAADIANINGQALDLALGGAAATWATNNINTSRSGGKLRINSTGYCTTTPTGATADGRIKARFVTVQDSQNQTLVGRFTNTSNFYQATAFGSQLKLMKMVAGVQTTLALTAVGQPAVVAGDIVELSCVGTAIRLLVNGATVLTATDSALTTGSGWGVQAFGSSGVLFDYDDIVIYDK